MRDKLEQLTRNELLVVSRKLKIKGCWKMKKKELIEAILLKDPTSVKEHLNLSLLHKIVTPLSIALGILGIIATLLVSPLFLKNVKSFGNIESVEIRDKKLIAFDAELKQRMKSFDSKIRRHIIEDIDQNGKKDILIGFSAQGKEYSRVIAFDSELNKKWEYVKEPNYPYSGKKSSKFNVLDLKVFEEKNKKIIAILFGASQWYPSALVMLDPGGKKLMEFWHPGHMYQFERIKNVFVIRGVNNHMHQTSIAKNFHKNLSVIFGLTYEHIYGEAPPYFGSSKKNSNIEWYYLLAGQEEKLEEMKVLENKIRVPTSCGKMFYFSENGKMEQEDDSGSYLCSIRLRLVKLGIMVLASGKIILKIPMQISPIIMEEEELLKELRSKDLLEKIKDAKAYSEAGNIDGRNQALKLYREVIKALSQKARQALNQELLKEAEKAFKKEHNAHAVSNYRALFEEVYNQK